MDLDTKISEFLARAETRPARSKLEPYDALLRSLRTRRWTYQKIAQALAAEFGLKVNPKTIWAYLQVQRSVVQHDTTPARSPVKAPTLQKRRFNLDT